MPGSLPDPLRVLYEVPPGPALPIPAELAAWYGGAFAIAEPGDRPRVLANFVQSVDGIVSFGPGPNPVLGEPHDRIVMSLLRAWADAVLVGHHTLAADPKVATWHWKTTSPPGARPLFEQMARRLGRPGPQWNVFVSGSGRGFDFGRRVFRDADVKAVVATTSRGEPPLRAALSASSGAAAEIWTLDGADGGVDLAALLARLGGAGRTHVLSEGGPSLHGALEVAGLLDEIWLSTRSLVGGTSAREPRPTFAGRPHPPDRVPALDLLSLRLSEPGSTLFARWRYR